MKKLSPLQKQRIDAHRHRAGSKAIKRKHLLARRRRGLEDAIKSHISNVPAKHHVPKTHVPLNLPTDVSLSTNFEATVNAVNEIRKTILDQKFGAIIYFDKVKEIEAAAALLLTAEIYRFRHLRSSRGSRMLTGTYPDDSLVYWRLKEVGFFELLDITDLHDGPPPAKSKDSGETFMKFCTGNTVLPDVANDFVKALVNGNSIIKSVNSGQLYGAIIEAMKNATEHAYQAATGHDVMPKRWWLAGISNPTKGEVVIVLYDQGVGIPHTLDQTLRDRMQKVAARLGARVQRALGLPATIYDSYMIDAATKLGRTSTKRQGRGKGFQTMKKFVNNCTGGELRIYSSQGVYQYANRAIKLRDENVSLGGTLIEWRISHAPLTAGEKA